jgi:hypothetical protein
MATARVTVGVRLVAFLMMAGGVLGILGAYMLTRGRWPSRDWASLVGPLISFPVFAWTFLKGLDLWRGRPSGYWWSTRLFALQIPILSIGSLTYEYSVGFSARFSFGETRQAFGADIGSSFNLLSSVQHGWMGGINVVALALFAYLLSQSRANRSENLTTQRVATIVSSPSRRQLPAWGTRQPPCTHRRRRAEDAAGTP